MEEEDAAKGWSRRALRSLKPKKKRKAKDKAVGGKKNEKDADVVMDDETPGRSGCHRPYPSTRDLGVAAADIQPLFFSRLPPRIPSTAIRDWRRTSPLLPPKLVRLIEDVVPSSSPPPPFWSTGVSRSITSFLPPPRGLQSALLDWEQLYSPDELENHSQPLETMQC